jgi:hypothetical protein
MQSLKFRLSTLIVLIMVIGVILGVVANLPPRKARFRELAQYYREKELRRQQDLLPYQAKIRELQQTCDEKIIKIKAQLEFARTESALRELSDLQKDLTTQKERAISPIRAAIKTLESRRQWASRMRRKYERAMAAPWLIVEADDPEPE